MAAAPKQALAEEMLQVQHAGQVHHEASYVGTRAVNFFFDKGGLGGSERIFFSLCICVCVKQHNRSCCESNDENRTYYGCGNALADGHVVHEAGGCKDAAGREVMTRRRLPAMICSLKRSCHTCHPASPPKARAHTGTIFVRGHLGLTNSPQNGLIIWTEMPKS